MRAKSVKVLLRNMVAEDDRYVIHGPEPLGPLPKISLGRLVYDSLLTCGSNEIALVDSVSKKSILYAELLELSCSLAESLRRRGYYGKHANFSIISENSLEFFVPIFSAFYLGATIAPINHTYTNQEFNHTLNITKPKVIFCSKALAKKIQSLRSDLRFIERIFVIDCKYRIDGCESIERFIDETLLGSRLKRIHLADVDPDEDVALVMCSSGTTGLPKGVMQTHSNMLVRYMHTMDPRYVTQRPPGSSYLGIMPFFHGFGLTTNLFALVTRQKIVVINRFEEAHFLQTIQDFKIQSLWLAPPLIVLLAKSPRVSNYDLSCVVEIASGAAPLSKETEKTVKKRLNVGTIRQGYGLTEVTLAVIMLCANEEKGGSSGKVISYMKAKVRDPETGRSLGPQQIGELCFKGPMVMKGYYGNPEATRNTFTNDGWLLSGDLGYYDRNGFFFVVDRLKELIKYKGFQVAPAELEAVLLTNPKIKDAGVVGLPDEEAGELPVAFVVKFPNVNLTEAEVVDFVKEQVSPHKRIRGGVIFLPEIPKNASGKILRKELRQLLKKYKSKL